LIDRQKKEGGGERERERERGQILNAKANMAKY
jgi:hypothetical protein